MKINNTIKATSLLLESSRITPKVSVAVSLSSKLLICYISDTS